MIFIVFPKKNAYLCMRDTTHVSCTQNITKIISKNVSCTQNITKIISKNEKNHLYGNSLDNGC